MSCFMYRERAVRGRRYPLTLGPTLSFVQGCICGQACCLLALRERTLRWRSMHKKFLTGYVNINECGHALMRYRHEGLQPRSRTEESSTSLLRHCSFIGTGEICSVTDCPKSHHWRCVATCAARCQCGSAERVGRKDRPVAHKVPHLLRCSGSAVGFCACIAHK